MAHIPQVALHAAREHNLDLSVREMVIPVEPFVFRCLIPSEKMVKAFKKAKKEGLSWLPTVPLSVVTYSQRRDEWRIMDGMHRICAAKEAGYKKISALVASGETYDYLEPILVGGYYGEDFVEMLSMVNPIVARNMDLRDDTRLAGLGRR